jgi:iron-sulfur cluster insertion protein
LALKSDKIADLQALGDMQGLRQRLYATRSIDEPAFQPHVVDMNDTPFAVTESAAKRIAFLAAKEAKPVMMRVAVLGGGCSGFQYNFSFEDQRNEDDLVIEHDGAAVLVDSTSLELLKGSQLDYVEEMVGSSFQVKNPNATSSCGCGNSFSV